MRSSPRIDWRQRWLGSMGVLRFRPCWSMPWTADTTSCAACATPPSPLTGVFPGRSGRVFRPCRAVPGYWGACSAPNRRDLASGSRFRVRDRESGQGRSSRGGVRPRGTAECRRGGHQAAVGGQRSRPGGRPRARACSWPVPQATAGRVATANANRCRATRAESVRRVRPHCQPPRFRPRKPCSTGGGRHTGPPRCAGSGHRSTGPRAPRSPRRPARPACPAGACGRRPRPRPARACPDRHPIAAGRPEGNVRCITQDGMPAQLRDPLPQVAAVQPPVAQDVHRHPDRHRRRRQEQQAAVVFDPGFGGVGLHHVPGHRERLFTAGHARQPPTRPAGCVGSHTRIRDGSVAESPSPGVHRPGTRRSSSGKQAAASTSVPGPQDRREGAVPVQPNCFQRNYGSDTF